MNERKRSLLIAEDSSISIAILLKVLGEEYTLHVATDGPSALESAKRDLPDLILLDVMMPGMDGFEVCRRLKEDPATRDIPVLFLTALNEVANESRGLELGAVDYITKPFNPVIVKARVRNHLELKKHQEELEFLVQQRTHELAEAHQRLKALDEAQRDYLYAISHELHTPMCGVLGITELALGTLEEEQRKRYTEMYVRSRTRLLMAVDGALLLAKLQSGDSPIDTGPVPLGKIVVETCDALQEAFSDRGVVLVLPEAKPGMVSAKEELLRQSVSTLFKTALRMASRGSSVTVAFREEEAETVLHIGFLGMPIPEKLQRTFFDTFSADRCGSYVQDLGLAIPLAAYVIRAMKGTVQLCSTDTGMEIRMVLRRLPPGN